MRTPWEEKGMSVQRLIVYQNDSHLKSNFANTAVSRKAVGKWTKVNANNLKT